VRFDHEGFNVGTLWIHVPTADQVEVVDAGMAGMPEVKFEDGHTIYAFPQDLKPITKGGAE
jgi:FtsP/CotA-like multicopper oxidase with cupredoxin domain